MTEIHMVSEHSLRETVTSIALVDVTGDNRDELVVTTIDGAVRIMRLGNEGSFVEVVRLANLPPVAAMAIGDVTGDGQPDIVIGGMDTSLRVVGLGGDNITEMCACPLRTMPTAVCVGNMVGDEKAEVIVSTDDNALRCFGWFSDTLDKLAHKVVERPVFSIAPFRSRSLPYSRFVFGDDSEHIFVYQYADDRLHEIGKFRARGPVNIVATGQITGGRLDEIVAVADRNVTVFGSGPTGIEIYDNIRAPGPVSAVVVDRITDGAPSPGQVVLTQTNSLLSIFSLDGRRLVEEASIKTRRRAADALVAVGDVDGDGHREIVQAVMNTIYLLRVTD